MASDRQQFARALNKWDTLRQQGEYSVPESAGSVAILVSGYAMMSDTRHECLKEINTYEREAHSIRDRLGQQGVSAYVVSRFNLDDMYEVLQDRRTSSIVTIGNGDLSGVCVSDEQIVDWRHIANGADHLKNGFFEQRHCGPAWRDLSVPLGTFAMRRHNAVSAAVNQKLPTEMTPGHESMIDTVHNEERLTYSILKRLLPRYFVEKEEDS